MNSIFNKPDRDKLIARISLLNEKNTPEWGKMNVFQMIKHCILWEEMVVENKTYKRAFVGRIFGKMALKSVLKDEKPLGRNSPTIREFIITETSGDINTEKIKWTAVIEQYEHLTISNFVHPFFGKMTKEQIGYMAYKHIDHHLRQFGA
jgi:Protein of unknown function (DUF1569)